MGAAQLRPSHEVMKFCGLSSSDLIKQPQNNIIKQRSGEKETVNKVVFRIGVGPA